MNVRITKYNPKHRDENGAYILDEWTDISDIGKYPDLETYEEYKVWEKKYWETIESILTDLKIERLDISYFEASIFTKSELAERYAHDDKELYNSFHKIYKAYNFSYKIFLHIFSILYLKINGRHHIGRFFQRRSFKKYSVSLKEAEKLFYLCMRGLIYVHFSGEKGVTIHTGYDFYAYLEADVNFTWDEVSGIYVEECPSFLCDKDLKEITERMF